MSQPAKGGLHHKYKCLKEYCEFVAYRVKMHVEKADVSLRHPVLFVNTNNAGNMQKKSVV